VIVQRQPYHVGMATGGLEASMAALGGLFDLHWTAVRSGQSFPLADPHGPVEDTARRVFSLEGPLHVELLEGSPGSVWAPHRGLHVHHLAYWSDDLAGDCGNLEADGWSIEVANYGPDGAPLNFAYLTRPGEPRMELVDVGLQPGFLDLVCPASK
jgi:hypothetical protein